MSVALLAETMAHEAPVERVRRATAAGQAFEEFKAELGRGTMLKRPGTPREVAACILFPVSDTELPRRPPAPDTSGARSSGAHNLLHGVTSAAVWKVVRSPEPGKVYLVASRCPVGAFFQNPRACAGCA